MKPYMFSVSHHREAGAVLIVGLVMVLLISIIALSGIRSSNLQEAMAGNMRDRNLTFQAAETGLVSGEALVDFRINPPECMNTATTCMRPLPVSQQPASESVVYLKGQDFINKSRESLSDLAAAGIEDKPRFIIEELSPFTPLMDGSDLSIGKGDDLVSLLPYRITARGTGLGPDSSVIVQSTYNRFAAE